MAAQLVSPFVQALRNTRKIRQTSPPFFFFLRGLWKPPPKHERHIRSVAECNKMVLCVTLRSIMFYCGENLLAFSHTPNLVDLDGCPRLLGQHVFGHPLHLQALSPNRTMSTRSTVLTGNQSKIHTWPPWLFALTQQQRCTQTFLS